MISHVGEIAASAIKYCNACKHFRRSALNGFPGSCSLFKHVDLVSGHKEPVSAKVARQEDALCGKGGRHFECQGLEVNL